MTPDRLNHLRVDLEEIAPGEFFITTRLHDQKIASLYLSGNRQYADEFLEVARRRILLNVASDEPGGPLGKVLQELIRMRQSLQASGE